MIGDALALLALAAAVHALVSAGNARLARGADAAPIGIGAGVVAVLALGLLDRGALLRVRYAIGEAGIEAPDAALVLALGLLGALAAVLTLGAERLARSADRPSPSPLARTVGRRALLPAVGFLVLGIGLVVLRARATGGLSFVRDGVAALGLALGATVLGSGALMRSEGARPDGDPSGREGADDLLVRAAAALTLVAAVGVGAEGWLRAGAVATRDLTAVVAAALVGLAAVAPLGWAVARRSLLVVALVAALAR